MLASTVVVATYFISFLSKMKLQIILFEIFVFLHQKNDAIMIDIGDDIVLPKFDSRVKFSPENFHHSQRSKIMFKWPTLSRRLMV